MSSEPTVNNSSDYPTAIVYKGKSYLIHPDYAQILSFSFLTRRIATKRDREILRRHAKQLTLHGQTNPGTHDS